MLYRWPNSRACNCATARQDLFVRLPAAGSIYYGLPPPPEARTASSIDANLLCVYIGGSAGAVVAARLSEIADWKVLLIEAGPDEPPGADVPSMVAMFLGSQIDWKYRTQNETHACLAQGGSCSWPRGKNLGGTSVHNGMMYIRGQPRDYDDWAKLGNRGWSWKDVLPYFMCSENNTELSRVGKRHHAKGGPLTVERFPWQPPITADVLYAAAEAGYPISEDLNGDRIVGFTVAQMNNRDGVRVSSAAAFLQPVRQRRNLHVLLNATATRIIIYNPARCEGNFAFDFNFFSLKRREIVVSGGAVNSPHLLLLSGIGPKEHLRAMNVSIVKDLPGVGENLQNHVSYTLSFTINEPNTYDLNWAAATEYIAFQGGPMASTGMSQITGKLPSTYTTADHPDIQLYFGGYQAACATTGQVGALLDNGRRRISMSPTLLQPRSRADLEKLDIPVVHDLPGVGRNLHNHVSYGLDFTIQYPDNSGNSFSPTDQYLANQTGPLSSTGLAQVTGILASEYTSPDDPDIQMFFAGFEANCGLNDSSSERHVQFIPVNLHTESRGKYLLIAAFALSSARKFDK
ncbi:unnamed protein product [Trichogramma brassicae]|uniref:Glucose-methanol-choline oxidoreductase N-terminal domain-containing protein n=1 Tax=Trichogramma brassicae TaxID=86971 RepID=A0A6H5HYQ9_9HYME|nr:unnamed protein product [Trichogramma brassicae]